jgi:tight adherence protein B
MTYGLDLEEAVASIAERVGHPDLHYVVVAINIQYGTGGNLAEILTGLAKVIRDREQMFRKAKAVSAEGRLSAIFLAVFPMLLAAALYLVNPDYYGNVSDEPMFPYFVGATIFLLISNILVMRWLVNIRV